ncbi:MAG: heavy metal translocating P-type ATPase [Eubacteriales bacterium]|nr:heavy metal translocating P-type ATPase [Eubacteriales bacterium]
MQIPMSVFERPGVLRVRFGRYTFTRVQANTLEQEFLARPYVISCIANPANGSIRIHYRGDQVLRDELLQDIKRIDFSSLAESAANNDQLRREVGREFRRKIVKKVLGRFVYSPLLPAKLYHAYVLLRAYRFLQLGLKTLAKRGLKIEVLDAAAISAALFIKDYRTANSVMFFLSISECLERYTSVRTKLDLNDSLKIRTDHVFRVNDLETMEAERIPMEALQIGDIIQVQAGTQIPIDGEVVAGLATVDQSSLTGESEPVKKEIGDSVFAATVISEGGLCIRVRQLAAETKISKIVDLIDHGESQKAMIQGQRERFADGIVPYSLLATFVTYLLTRNLYKALSILMVDYSCAIKLSTPIAVMTAIRQAAEREILIKGGRYLEVFADAPTLIFDKTGTLTRSCPEVSEVIAFEPYTRHEVLRDAACIEEHFPHSLANAIVRKAAEEGIEHRERHAEVHYIIAHGIKTSIAGEEVLIGSRHFIFNVEKVLIHPHEQALIDEKAQQYSIVYMAVGGRCVGAICLEDPPRNEAKACLEKLYALGVNETLMLTGDSERAARAIGKRLNISAYRSEVLPEDKVDYVREVQERVGRAVMVGDGINDTPALSLADVSIAMKDASDIAREVSDIILLRSHLEDLVYLRKLSQALMNRINTNFTNIIGLNTLFISLGLFGIIPPTTAAFLHNSTTFVISATSMRQYYIDERSDTERAKLIQDAIDVCESL